VRRHSTMGVEHSLSVNPIRDGIACCKACHKDFIGCCNSTSGDEASLCITCAQHDWTEGFLDTEIVDISPPEQFVDTAGKALYELTRSTMTLSKDGTEVTRIWKADFDGNVIKVTKGRYGFQDDQLLRASGPLTGRIDDWFSVAKLNGKEIEKGAFRDEFGDRPTIHIKGFKSKTANVYDECVMEKLKRFEVLAWDGDDYDMTGYTRLVPMYLNSTPSGVAIAFKRRLEIPSFNQRWYSWMAKHPGRICVVPIDDPEDFESWGILEEVKVYAHSVPAPAQQCFMLGRIAMKLTGAVEVVALGGPGISANEAMAGFPDKVHWTVYALSRGQRERNPSLCDFARRSLKKRNSNVRLGLVMGKDPDEMNAFHYDA